MNYVYVIAKYEVLSSIYLIDHSPLNVSKRIRREVYERLFTRRHLTTRKLSVVSGWLRCIVAVCALPEHPPNGGYVCMTAPAAKQAPDSIIHIVLPANFIKFASYQNA